MNEGDWICNAICGNINFARRTSCNRCKKEKPNGKPFKKFGTKIGNSAAKKCRGLFTADDWKCNKCFNVNWARRQTCNLCNAPKFGENQIKMAENQNLDEKCNSHVERKVDMNSDPLHDQFEQAVMLKIKTLYESKVQFEELFEEQFNTELRKLKNEENIKEIQNLLNQTKTKTQDSATQYLDVKDVEIKIKVEQTSEIS